METEYALTPRATLQTQFGYGGAGEARTQGLKGSVRID